MTSRGEISAQPETARQQSRAEWDAVAPGWYARREELWEVSRPVSEWMIRRLDPHPGNTVLELAAGLGDTGLEAGTLVGRSPAPRVGCLAELRGPDGSYEPG